MALTYRRFEPTGLAALYVECYWTLEGDSGDGGAPEPVLPDGHAELIWNLADPFERHDAGGRRRQSLALVVGQVTGPFLIGPTGRVDLLAARFRPAALGAWLGGVSAGELVDADIPIVDVRGGVLGSVADEAHEAPTSEARVGVLAARLERDLRRAPPVDPRVAAAVDRIAGTHGTARIADLAHMVGLGPRQLARAFVAHVGITPKKLARIFRFQRLVSTLSHGGPADRLGLAVRCGYYDQAHLIRDFREFAGCPPTAYLEGEHGLASLFVHGR